MNKKMPRDLVDTKDNYLIGFVPLLFLHAEKARDVSEEKVYLIEEIWMSK